MSLSRITGLALLAFLLAGCAGGGGPAKPRPAGARPSVSTGSRPQSTIVVVPEIMPAAGLEGVIGAPATALTRRFGQPRLDLAEGDARKLQFTGPDCVLDIFLYPLAAAAEPTATHVEARLRQGGAPVDPGACIREVQAR